MGPTRYMDLAAMLIAATIWVVAVAVLRRKRSSGVYLVFFTIFYIYLVKVLDYTLFQFQSLILLKYFMPHLMLRGQEAGRALNLIPLFTLRLDDVKTSLLNVLLFIPFGIGLPVITKVRLKQTVIAGALFSIGIEVLQFVTGYLAHMTFRIADVNDVIFNSMGAMIGYGLFVWAKRKF